MTGWISLHRSIQKHWIFEENRKFSRFEAWVDILLMVNHSDNKIMLDGKLVTVKRGQRVTSLRQLGERWNWSITKVDKFLKILETDEMLVVKKDTKKTVLTVVNYDDYQDEDSKKRHRKDSEKTVKRHRNNTEKTQKETNNNDNKENNENNENNEKKKATAFDFFQNNGFGFITQYTIDDLNYYLDSFENDSDEIITAALKIAKDRNKTTWGYAKSILNNWLNTNLQSIEQVRAHEIQQKNMREQKPYKPNALRSKEMTPKWLENPKTNNEPNANSDDNLDKDRELFLKQLKAKETNNTN